MEIEYSPGFDKQFKKSPIKVQQAFKVRLKLFAAEPKHPLLHNHTLKGMYRNIHSLNVTGDWRALYRVVDREAVYFVALGTHSQLYG